MCGAAARAFPGAQQMFASISCIYEAARKRGITVLKAMTVILLPLVVGLGAGFAQEKPATPAKGDQAENLTPLGRVENAPKGTLKNPYTDNKQAIEAGRGLFFGYGCNGCHGGTGGGGMGPPINNEVWIYGSDDDTLFRLITLGSDELQKRGYFRQGMEAVVAPMPPVGQLVKSDGDLWKIIAFVRSVYTGDPSRKNW
jgi:mono/diheme cytochrome c family protein